MSSFSIKENPKLRELKNRTPAASAASPPADQKVCVECQKTDGPFEHVDEETGKPLCLGCVAEEKPSSDSAVYGADGGDDEDYASSAAAIFQLRATYIVATYHNEKRTSGFNVTTTNPLVELTKNIPAELATWLVSKVPDFRMHEVVGKEFRKLVGDLGPRAVRIAKYKPDQMNERQAEIDGYKTAFSAMLNFIVDNWDLRKKLLPVELSTLETLAADLRNSEIKILTRFQIGEVTTIQASAKAFGEYLEMLLDTHNQPSFQSLMEEIPAMAPQE